MWHTRDSIRMHVVGVCTCIVLYLTAIYCARGVCVFRRVIFSRLSIAKLYTALTPRLCDYADSRTIGKWSIARSQPNLPGPTDHYRYDNIGVRFSKAFSSMFIFIRDSCREHYQNNTQSAFVRNDYERYCCCFTLRTRSLAIAYTNVQLLGYAVAFFGSLYAKRTKILFSKNYRLNS